MELQLFADPQLPLHQQLEAYEHPGKWTNRLILGDSLVVMNSLLSHGEAVAYANVRTVEEQNRQTVP